MSQPAIVLGWSLFPGFPCLQPRQLSTRAGQGGAALCLPACQPAVLPVRPGRTLRGAASQRAADARWPTCPDPPRELRFHTRYAAGTAAYVAAGKYGKQLLEGGGAMEGPHWWQARHGPAGLGRRPAAFSCRSRLLRGAQNEIEPASDQHTMCDAPCAAGWSGPGGHSAGVCLHWAAGEQGNGGSEC